MDYLVSATPEECLDSVTAYLLGHGYTVEERTDRSATLARGPEMPMLDLNERLETKHDHR
jgi:hypothetical protein